MDTGGGGGRGGVTPLCDEHLGNIGLRSYTRTNRILSIRQAKWQFLPMWIF